MRIFASTSVTSIHLVPVRVEKHFINFDQVSVSNSARKTAKRLFWLLNKQ